MPDATITSTASTFGTITGTFAADQSTVTGTITGVVAGTLTGSVGVPGPQGPTGATGATGATGPQGVPGQGVPVGGSAGQFLQKIDGTNYNTDWVTVNLSVFAVKANNLSDLADAPTARTNLGLGTMATATAADYSTTTVANGLYYPLSGNPSGFLTSVPPPTLTNLTSDISWDGSANTGRLLIAGVNDIGGGNTEARLNFTSGVPTQPATGDFWTNGTDFFYRESGSTKTIASQSYVSANYQPLSGMSSYLTTASAAATYFTIASAASKADLASPTFTGTPTLPTGTIATTQSPGNNTTAVATTAFVTAAVPAFATFTQSRAATSTTVAQSPGSEMWQMMNPGFIPIIRSSLSYAATGTMGAAAIGNYTSRMTMGTAGAASASFRTFGGSQIDQTYICVSKGYRSYIDFSRFTWCSGRFYTEDTWTDPQVSAGYYFGKANNSVNGNLARKGFGWRIYGNATAGNRTAILQVHNGTTLTDVSTSFALVAQQYFDWDIVSLGNGTVTLYINGTQYATTSAGPTGDTSYSGTSPVIWNEEFVSTGTTAGYNATFSRGLLYIAP